MEHRQWDNVDVWNIHSLCEKNNCKEKTYTNLVFLKEIWCAFMIDEDHIIMSLYHLEKDTKINNFHHKMYQHLKLSHQYGFYD